MIEVITHSKNTGDAEPLYAYKAAEVEAFLGRVLRLPGDWAELGIVHPSRDGIAPCGKTRLGTIHRTRMGLVRYLARPSLGK